MAVGVECFEKVRIMCLVIPNIWSVCICRSLLGEAKCRHGSYTDNQLPSTLSAGDGVPPSDPDEKHYQGLHSTKGKGVESIKHPPCLVVELTAGDYDAGYVGASFHFDEVH